MDAVDYMREKKRMCCTYSDCTGCPFYSLNVNCHIVTHSSDEERIEAVQIVEQWSKEHPAMTNDKLQNEPYKEPERV